MKKDGRTKLRCSRKLPNKQLDSFEAVVLTKDSAEAKKNYESMGYEVKVVS